jgi:peptidoglycan hydrolase-like protein with peptidoglycan-binding domain
MAVKTLKVGDKGKEVKALQEKLNDAKLGTRLTANGEFGPETEEAVKEFQKKNRLKPDGVANEKLYQALCYNEK